MTCEKIQVIPLEVRSDERGFLMEILRASKINMELKQIYLSVVYGNAIKNKDKFHCHAKQQTCLCCIKGKVKIVLVEVIDQEQKITEIITGDNGHHLIIIPPKVLYAWKGLSGESFIISCTSEEYNHSNPDELNIKNDFYEWGEK